MKRVVWFLNFHVKLFCLPVIKSPDPLGNAIGHDFSHTNRDSISNLTHTFGPRTLEDEPIWKCLQSCPFAYGKIPNITVRIDEHILAPGNAVPSSLQGFCRLIEGTSGMTGICFGPSLKFMVSNTGFFAFFRIGQIENASRMVNHGNILSESIKNRPRPSFDLDTNNGRRFLAILCLSQYSPEIRWEYNSASSEWVGSGNDQFSQTSERKPTIITRSRFWGTP